MVFIETKQQEGVNSVKPESGHPSDSLTTRYSFILHFFRTVKPSGMIQFWKRMEGEAARMETKVARMEAEAARTRHSRSLSPHQSCLREDECPCLQMLIHLLALCPLLGFPLVCCKHGSVAKLFLLCETRT